jgi:abelson tyrosine-protein kinase 1/abelson tyrosine-protein kinase 2
VIGTLEAPDYAMFVSHRSRDGQVHFEAFDDRRNGEKWGKFTTDESLPGTAVGGPDWQDRDDHPVDELYTSKVSTNGDSATGWNSLILSRLRFRPDEDEPTSQ